MPEIGRIKRLREFTKYFAWIFKFCKNLFCHFQFFIKVVDPDMDCSALAFDHYWFWREFAAHV